MCITMESMWKSYFQNVKGPYRSCVLFGFGDSIKVGRYMLYSSYVNYAVMIRWTTRFVLCWYVIITYDHVMYFSLTPYAILRMKTSSNGNIFRITGSLCGEFTTHRWIPLTNANDAEIWCLLWSAPEQTAEQTIETPMRWDAIALIMAALQWDIFISGYIKYTDINAIHRSNQTNCKIFDKSLGQTYQYTVCWCNLAQLPIPACAIDSMITICMTVNH